MNHKNFAQVVQLIEKHGNTYFERALQDLDTALKKLYGETEVSLQQLSATFRRGDLIQKLLEIAISNG